MRIVIVGDGKVGFTLSAQLSREGHDVVVIDNKKDVVGESSERLDVLAIKGNGTVMEIQRQAGVPDSDLLIAVTSGDEINLVCCLVAKKLGCKSTIARVRNPEYSEQLSQMQEELGLTMTINPERAAASEIFTILSFPSFIKTETFAKGRAHIAEVKVSDSSPLAGKKLRELYELNKIRALICVVQRGEETVIPGGNFVLQAGDKLYATAPTFNLDKLAGILDVENKRIRNVMIIGGGRISHYLASNLLRAGVSVKIIENRAERCQELAESLPKAVVIHADGSSQRVLLAEGIEGTDAVVTLTNMDEENLIISMYANYKGVPKVVTKINRTEYNEVFYDKGIDCVVSPKDLTADTIIRYVRSMSNAEPEAMLALYRIAEGNADAMEFHAVDGTRNLGRTLAEVTLKPNILIACIHRGGSAIVPKGHDAIEKGDRVFVVADAKYSISELNDIFAEGDID